MCVCVCAYYHNSVLCSCPLWQLFTLPSLQVHPTETQYCAETCTPSTSSKREAWRGADTHFSLESVCRKWISWRSRGCIKSCLLLIWYLNIILDHFWGANESFTFLYSKINCSIFLAIEQHCLAFRWSYLKFWACLGGKKRRESPNRRDVLHKTTVFSVKLLD